MGGVSLALPQKDPAEVWYQPSRLTLGKKANESIPQNVAHIPKRLISDKDRNQH